jgi:hypothetical protein
MKFYLPAIVFASLTVLSACERPEPGSESDDRSDRQDRHDERRAESDERSESTLLAQTRTVENFDSIELRGAAELLINVGPAASLNLDASERTLKYVETRVHGEKLIIDVSKSQAWFSNQGHLKITITTPTLKSLESNGAGDIEIRGLNGGEQELVLAGAHNVKGEGRLDKLKLKLSGAGNINYKNVIVTDARVTVNGAGNVEINTSESLRAEVNGVGAVTYSGNPRKVESELHGLGSISRADKQSKDDSPADSAADTAETQKRE